MLHSLALGLLTAACSPGKSVEGLAPNDPVLQPVVVSIDLRTARGRMGTDEALPITAKGRLNVGGEVNEPSDWEAIDGGTVTPVGDSSTALFSSKTTGTFRVVGRGKGKKNGQSGGSTDTTTTAQPVDTVTVVVTDPTDSPVVSLRIDPATAIVPIGGTRAFIAYARHQDGSESNPIDVDWSPSSGGVVTPKGSAADFRAGSIEGEFPFTGTLTRASVYSAVAVPEVTRAWLTEDFSSYASSSELIANGRGVFNTVEDMNVGRISLDLSQGHGSSTRSMRYDFPDRSADTSNRCRDFTISRAVRLPEAVQEVWVEAWVMFSSNWTTKAPADWGCTSGNGYKFIFGSVTGASYGRFGLYAGVGGDGKTTGQWQAGEPPNEGTIRASMSSFPFFDGKWHRYRMHMRVNTNGANTGALALWLDDTRVANIQNLDVQASSIYQLPLGRNLNQGPASPQSIWWGSISVYRTNPNW